MGIELLFCYASFRIFLAIDFKFFIIQKKHSSNLGEREQKLNFVMAALFHFFKPFLLFLFGSFGGDLVEGLFLKIELHCGFDQQVRMCVYFGAALNPPPCFNCWCGCKGENLVTSVDPCQADIITAPLTIGRSSITSSIGFYFSSVLPSVGHHPFHFG